MEGGRGWRSSWFFVLGCLLYLDDQTQNLNCGSRCLVFNRGMLYLTFLYKKVSLGLFHYQWMTEWMDEWVTKLLYQLIYKTNELDPPGGIYYHR